jgi:hypothetical protein
MLWSRASASETPDPERTAPSLRPSYFPSTITTS